MLRSRNHLLQLSSVALWPGQRRTLRRSTESPCNCLDWWSTTHGQGRWVASTRPAVPRRVCSGVGPRFSSRASAQWTRVARCRLRPWPRRGHGLCRGNFTGAGYRARPARRTLSATWLPGGPSDRRFDREHHRWSRRVACSLVFDQAATRQPPNERWSWTWALASDPASG